MKQSKSEWIWKTKTLYDLNARGIDWDEIDENGLEEKNEKMNEEEFREKRMRELDEIWSDHGETLDGFWNYQGQNELRIQEGSYFNSWKGSQENEEYSIEYYATLKTDPPPPWKSSIFENPKPAKDSSNDHLYSMHLNEKKHNFEENSDSKFHSINDSGSMSLCSCLSPKKGASESSDLLDDYFSSSNSDQNLKKKKTHLVPDYNIQVNKAVSLELFKDPNPKPFKIPKVSKAQKDRMGQELSGISNLPGPSSKIRKSRIPKLKKNQKVQEQKKQSSGISPSLHGFSSEGQESKSSEAPPSKEVLQKTQSNYQDTSEVRAPPSTHKTFPNILTSVWETKSQTNPTSEALTNPYDPRIKNPNVDLKDVSLDLWKPAPKSSNSDSHPPQSTDQLPQDSENMDYPSFNSKSVPYVSPIRRCSRLPLMESFNKSRIPIPLNPGVQPFNPGYQAPLGSSLPSIDSFFKPNIQSPQGPPPKIGVWNYQNPGVPVQFQFSSGSHPTPQHEQQPTPVWKPKEQMYPIPEEIAPPQKNEPIQENAYIEAIIRDLQMTSSNSGSQWSLQDQNVPTTAPKPSNPSSWYFDPSLGSWVDRRQESEQMEGTQKYLQESPGSLAQNTLREEQKTSSEVSYSELIKTRKAKHQQEKMMKAVLQRAKKIGKRNKKEEKEEEKAGNVDEEVNNLVNKILAESKRREAEDQQKKEIEIAKFFRN